MIGSLLLALFEALLIGSYFRLCLRIDDNKVEWYNRAY